MLQDTGGGDLRLYVPYAFSSPLEHSSVLTPHCQYVMTDRFIQIVQNADYDISIRGFNVIYSNCLGNDPIYSLSLTFYLLVKRRVVTQLKHNKNRNLICSGNLSK